MLKIKGTSLYPQHIQEAMNVLEISDYIIEAKNDEFGNDLVILKISRKLNENFGNSIKITGPITN